MAEATPPISAYMTSRFERIEPSSDEAAEAGNGKPGRCVEAAQVTRTRRAGQPTGAEVAIGAAKTVK